MTPNQIELVRHALGLNYRNKSFRNHFVAGKTHSDYPAWIMLVESGDAGVKHTHHLSAGDSCFWATEKGAKAVLKKGESLCAEDFPPTESKDANTI